MSEFKSGFGLAPIKKEGSIADPDEFTWECACEACALKYQKWKAMAMALEALECANSPNGDYENEIAALKERLAQPEQEPVAWGVFEGNLHDMFFTLKEAHEMARLKGSHAKVKPLYTHPTRGTWVGLTDEEIWTVLQFRGYNTDTIEIARAIEARLKERNT
jgi:hypothetical protein